MEDEEPAEFRETCNLAIHTIVIRWADLPDELVTDALVKALDHVVLCEFLVQVAQMLLAENHKAIQALVLDRFDKPFRVAIAIWALRSDFHALHDSGFKHSDECIREQRVPTVD